MVVQNNLTYKRKVLLVIIISALIKLLCASSVELSSAEVYYWTYSLHLQLNYFDHPPIVGWLIRLTTLNNSLNYVILVRIGAVIASSGSAWLMFKIGTEIYNERAGWFATLLFTTSLYGTYITGAFILPDSPQVFFWLAAILILIKISRLTTVDRSFSLWVLFGIFSGLCIMCKIHGVFLWIGIILYLILFDRKWLQNKGIFIAALITLAIASPIIFWNIQNNFITYKFHSSRVSLPGSSIDITRFLKEMLKSIFIIINPFNFFLICSGIIWSFKKQTKENKNINFLVMCCSLPLIFILLFVSFFRDTLAHWSGPAYTCLLIIPSLQIAAGSATQLRRHLLIIKLGLAYSLIVILSEIAVVNYFPGTLSDQKDGLTIGNGDLTLDMYGWKESGKQFDLIFKEDVAKKKMPLTAPILVTKWFPAAHIDFYIAARTGQETFGLGEIFQLGNYHWSNEYKRPLKIGDSAYYVMPSNLFDYKTFDRLVERFSTYELGKTIEVKRSGVVCKKVYVFRLMGFKGSTALN